MSTIEKSPIQHRHGRRVGWTCLVAAAAALVVPVPYDILQSVGSRDGRAIDMAGYQHTRAVNTTDTPRLHHGDEIFGVILDLDVAATQNEHAADRRLLALFLAVPGAFLLGRHAKDPASS